MMAEQSKAELITALQSAVDETLAYFEGAGRRNPARIGQWGAWEVLAHFPYWHDATAWGIRSGAGGHQRRIGRRRAHSPEMREQGTLA